jgi:hypothetical protein
VSRLLVATGDAERGRRGEGETRRRGDAERITQKQLAGGRWQVAGGSRQVAVGRWQSAGGSRQVAVGNWQSEIANGFSSVPALLQVPNNIPNSESRRVELMTDSKGSL